MQEPRPCRIIQIIPAEGWFAKYRNDDGSVFYSPLVCFALVEEKNGHTFVRGMDADSSGIIDFADEPQNFLGFFKRDETVNEADGLDE